jgi:predicted nucleotidyltransferase component of viral defense system
VIELEGGERLTVQVFAGFEAVPAGDLVQSTTAPALRRVALRRYLADKVQCVVERIEARDLVDIAHVMSARPDLEPALRRALRNQDALLVAERLQGWSDAAIRDDLRAHTDTRPETAIAMRDRLLDLVRAEGRS